MGKDVEKEFENILDELLELNRDLLSLCKKKQEVILENNNDQLEVLTKEQEIISDQLNEVNKKRRQLSGEILQNDSSPFPLERVTEELKKRSEIDLNERRIKLKQILRDIQKFSKENSKLLRNRLTIYEDIFDELSNANSSETYDEDTLKEQNETNEALVIDEAI